MKSSDRIVTFACLAASLAAFCVSAASQEGIAHHGDLSRFARVWERARAGRPITIAVLGGSITQGAGASDHAHCWAEVLAADWRKKFPKSAITLVNAGIGATGSKIGACRVGEDVVAKNPDVTVVEFSINDDASEECTEAYEGVMRQLLSATNSMAVVALGMVCQDGGSAQEQHLEVARHYGIPYVSYRDAIYPSVRDGRRKWSDISPDAVHPNDFGHAFAARLVDDFLFADYDASAAHPKPVPEVPPLKVPLHSARFDSGRFIRMEQAEIVANEGFFPLMDQAWGMGLACTNAHGRLVLRAKGSSVAILHRLGRDPYSWGKIAVSVDGGEPQTIDCYRDVWWWFTPAVFLCRDKPGEHLVEIRTLPEKNEKSSGYGCHLTGILVADPGGASPASEIILRKPLLRWLWGGFGFHNSESSMTGVMTDEFRDERVVKSFLEMSPSYSRVFAGYYNWTTNAMDRFADYYDATFRKCKTTLYVVPGRMPVITSDFDADKYAEAVAERLDYVVHRRGCTKIRYYALSNELSVGPTYCWFPQGHWDDYKRISMALQRAFARHDLDIGIMGPDSSGYDRLCDVDWALQNANEQTEVYCWHLYDRKHKPGDRATYDELFKAVRELASKCCRVEKRISIGEWGFTGANAPYGVGQMRDDGHLGFRRPGSVEANEAAIARAEMGLAILNGGAMHGITWTMVDYPDPFIREDGDSPDEKAVYDLGRFSGAPHTLDIRYNKNGVFRWCDEERDYSAYPDLYTMGYLVKLFRKGARLLTSETQDPDLRVGAVTNPDGSCSVAVVNWGVAKRIRVRSEHVPSQPFRIYEYDSAHPPSNAFNDLQSAKGTVAAQGGAFEAEVPGRSLTYFTTDYADRVPAPVTGVCVGDGKVTWKPAGDPDHVYYRVYRDGEQIASTVATNAVLKGTGTYTVRSVDRWGNIGTESGKSSLKPKIL